MTTAAFRQASGQLSAVSSQLEDLIRSAASFDRLRSDLAIDLKPLASRLSPAIFNIHLLGRAQVYADFVGDRRRVTGDRRPATVVGLPSPVLRPVLGLRSFFGAVITDMTFEPLPFDEAIDFFRRKLNLTPAQYAALSDAARAKAFTITTGAGQQVVSSIKDLLDEALSNGLTLKEFQNQAADILDAAGVSERTPWYWETVYRTNLQTSYQAGRWKQQSDPAVVAELPYLRYVSARLPTSRPSHVEKHGLVYPVGDPFWSEWFPPNGFNCLCSTMSISQSLLDRRGWEVSTARNFIYPDADKGFDINAGAEAI